jgi:hypothetical protein
MVLEYKVLSPCYVWPQTRGVGSLHRAPPKHWPREKSRRGLRSILVGGFCWYFGYRVYGGCKGAAGPGCLKPPCGVGEKRFPGGFSAASAAMMEISVDLRTRPAWWQLGHLGGWRPVWPLCPGLVVCCNIVGYRARRPQPCKPWGSSRRWSPLAAWPREWRHGVPAEDSVGAIVERAEIGDHTAVSDPHQEGAEEINQELAWQLVTQIVFGQRKRRSIQRFFEIQPESGSPQQLGQHWFITAYIAVYTYTGTVQCTTVLETKYCPCWVWPRTRGVGSLHRL